MFILRMRNTRAWDAAPWQHVRKQSVSHFQGYHKMWRCSWICTKTLVLVIKTQLGKTRNSVCSCSDNVITATPYGVMESAFYVCKVNPHLLQERETIPRAAIQRVAGEGPTALWFWHILCTHFRRLKRKSRNLIFYPCSGFVFQKEYRALKRFLGLVP